MRVIWATSVALSLGAPAAPSVPTCQDLMSEADAPAFCLQNTGDDIVPIFGYEQRPDSYSTSIDAEGSGGINALAPHIGSVSATDELAQFEGWDWLCVQRGDLKSGAAQFFRQPSVDLHDFQTPFGALSCIHR